MQDLRIILRSDLDISEDIVTNSDFSDGLNDWTSQYFYESGGYAYNRNTDPFGNYLQQDCLTIGKRYKISLSIYKIVKSSTTGNDGGLAGDVRQNIFKIAAGNNVYTCSGVTSGQFHGDIYLDCLDNTNLSFWFNKGVIGHIDYIKVYEVFEESELNLYPDEKINLNFSIAEVQDITKRNSYGTLNFKIPGNKNNNHIFNHIYNINKDDYGFTFRTNPTVIVYQNNVEILKGKLELNEIINDGNEIIYDISIYDNLIDFFDKLKDKKIFGNADTSDDLDFSNYNHFLTYETIYNSWLYHNDTATTFGNGYVYPYIGQDTAENGICRIKYMRPAFFIKEIIDKIFDKQGYSYDCSLFDSTLFKQLLYYKHSSKIKVDQSDIDSRKVSAVDNRNITRDIFFKYFGSTDYTLANYDQRYNTFELEPYYIGTYNNFDYNLKSFKINKTGNYNINGYHNHNIFISTAFPNTTIYCFDPVSYIDVDFEIYYNLKIMKNGSLLWQETQRLLPGSATDFKKFTTDVDGNCFLFTNNSSDVTINYDLELLQGDEIVLQAEIKLIYPDNLYKWCLSPLGIAGIELYFNNRLIGGNNNFNLECSGEYVDEGSKINCNEFFKDINQLDFMTDIIKMFNLYVIEDRDKINNFIIKTRDEFYSGNTITDWTYKLDNNTEIIIEPLDFYKNNFSFKYLSDSDELNKRYKDKNLIEYGQYKEIINEKYKYNNFDLKLFSPSVLGLVEENIPGTILTPIDSDYNPRILICKGAISTGGLSFEYLSNNNQVAYGGFGVPNPVPYYYYAGHLDNPFNDTIDLNFGQFIEYFFNLTSNINTITNNNLYNLYYGKMINEYKDQDSAKVTAYFKLNESDINTLDFSDYIFIQSKYGGTYYYLNKIIDYNPNQLTKVELLKITNLDYTYDSANTYKFYNANKDIKTFTNNDLYDNNNQTIIINNSYGDNNISYIVYNINIEGGSGNTIKSGSYNINIINSSNVIVNENCNNVNVYNTNDIVINESNITIINGSRVYDYGYTEAFGTIRKDEDNKFGVDIIDTIFGGRNCNREWSSLKPFNIIKG